MNNLALEGRSIVVFDAEIKRSIDQCSRGWDSLDEMGVSTLCLFDYRSMRYRVFDDSNIAEAIAVLWSADLTVGYNTVKFDWRLLQATYPGALPTNPRHGRDYDMLREIWIVQGLDPDRFDKRTHGGSKLDDIAFQTLGMRKSGNGALAPLLYQAGKLAEVIDYCLEDVRIERSLFEFIHRWSFVVKAGQVIGLPGPIGDSHPANNQ